MAIKNEIVDELLKDADPKKVFSSEGLLGDIKKALAERMLNAEMDEHLENEAAGSGTANEPGGNHRNGYRRRRHHRTSQVELEIPRDRRGTFEPQLMAKYQRRFTGFDDKILFDVRPRHERAGHPGHLASSTALRSRRADLHGDRRGRGGGHDAGRRGHWIRSGRSSSSTPSGEGAR